MQITKQGNTLLTICMITTTVLLVGLYVLRSYAFYNDIINQQHQYWHRYYTYEGCTDYALAYFLENRSLKSISVLYNQKKCMYTLHIQNESSQENSINLLITIEQQKQSVAIARINLERHNQSWVITNRTLSIQSSIDLDKKALLPYTKILKS